MMATMANKQRGVSMSGFLGTVVVLILVLIAGMKVLPAYLDDRTIKNKFVEVAHDPALKNATVNDIQIAYVHRAIAENITAIKPGDVEVIKDADGITLSASYSVKIPLGGNASLVLEFNPSSANP